MKIIFDHLHGHVLNDRVFCEAFVLPDGEKEYELLELGFLPNVQPPIYWYQAKSCRINNNNVKLSYRKRKILSQITIQILNYVDVKEQVDTFFNVYIEERKLDLLDSYNKNSLMDDLKVMVTLINGNVVAYTRFREFDEVILGLETAFDSIHPKMSLGISAILLLSDYGKSKNKNYLYIYECYDNYFSYKLTIPGAEYWEGEKWITV